jgi:alkylation response protein AidB-like acyl-CoA dehydrogenase
MLSSGGSARVQSSFGGTTEIQKEIIARGLGL